MDFKYFEKADKFIRLKEKEIKCDICEEMKLCFNAKAYRGKDELSSVCPDCLRTGKLSRFDISTCNGDFGELKKQIKALNPNFSDYEVDKIAKEKTIELKTTTPRLVTWQDWYWPCADGDYCRFIGYGSKPFYKELAGLLPVEDFFENTFYEKDSYEEYLWDDVPDKEVKNYNDSNDYGTLFYVFKSLHSDKIITIWDCD